MAGVYWLGVVQDRPQIDRLTVGTAVVGAVYTMTLTCGPITKVATYKAVTGDTTTSIAAAMVAAWAASPDGEIKELAAAVDPNATAQFLVTGPANGDDFSLAAAASGGATFTRAAEQVPASAGDAANVLNYSTGALPANTDDLIFDRGDRGPTKGLAAITAKALAHLYRYPGFTGQIGRPDQNPNGYPEYRAKFLETKTAVLTLQHADSDQGQQLRFKCTAAALAVNVSGSAAPNTSLPVVEVYNCPANSTFYAAGASLGVGMQPQADTAGLLNASDSRIWTGVLNVFTTPGTLELTDCTGFIASGYVSAKFTGPNSNITVTPGGAASGSGTEVFKGTLSWQSLGTPGDVTVGPGAIYDLSHAPGIVPAHDVAAMEGATIDNRAGRIGSGWTLTPVNCSMAAIAYTGPPNEVHTIT